MSYVIRCEEKKEEIDMKAKEWLKKGVATKDPMDRFSNLWKGFNNLFASENGGTERNKIKNYLSSSNLSEDSASEIITECNEAIGYLLSKPVVNMRDNGRDTQRDIDTFESAKSKLEKLNALFMVIYQVRCTLEHGQKSPNRKRDIILCIHCSNIVTKVLEECT